MALFEYAYDVNTPVHPVSAPDYMPVEQLRALQLHRLQQLVQRCYEKVPLTRKRMDERGVRPEHIKTLKDIKLLPFMMKSDEMFSSAICSVLYNVEVNALLSACDIRHG